MDGAEVEIATNAVVIHNVGARMHTVQLALERDTPGRPAGPALGTGVQQNLWHWRCTGHWSATESVALAKPLHRSASQRLALTGNGHWSAVQKPTKCPLSAPKSLRKDSKLYQGEPRE